MTQRQRILRMLEEAGPGGIRSDHFIANYMPRAAARVQELKDQGFPILSEREGKYVRWILDIDNVGSSTEGRDQAGNSIPQPVDATLGVASGVAASVSSSPSPPGDSTEAPPANPYEYEVWAA